MSSIDVHIKLFSGIWMAIIRIRNILCICLKLHLSSCHSLPIFFISKNHCLVNFIFGLHLFYHAVDILPIVLILYCIVWLYFISSDCGILIHENLLKYLSNVLLNSLCFLGQYHEVHNIIVWSLIQNYNQILNKDLFNKFGNLFNIIRKWVTDELPVKYFIFRYFDPELLMNPKPINVRNAKTIISKTSKV